MEKKENIILIGAGGHAKAVIDVIETEGRFNIYGLIDLKENVGKKVLGYEIIGTDEDLPKLFNEVKNAIITIGHIYNVEPRIKLYNLLKEIGYNLPVIISPYAYVSKYAKIGEGTVVMHHAAVNASAIIGSNCIINTKALVEHDAIIGDHCHISTGAVINGGVKVGNYSFIGSNAVTKQYIEIPEKSFIKAGSLVK